MQQERALASPCVAICALDEQDICIGCQRSADEITRWGRMDNQQRRVVLLRCAERAESSGRIICQSR